MVERAQRAVRLVQHEALVGSVRVEYCAAPRSGGGWFAVGNVIQESGAPDPVTPVVSGLGATEPLAVERMLRGVADRRDAGAADRTSAYPDSFAGVGRTPAT